MTAARHDLGDKVASRRHDLNMSATNIPSACKIANIAQNDAMILPYHANLDRMIFSERTGIVLSEEAAGIEAPHCCVLEREAD